MFNFSNMFNVFKRKDNLPTEKNNLDDSLQSDLVGKTINEKYQVSMVLGRGAFGIVYKAIQLPLKRNVAIKVMHPHLIADNKIQISERFEDEAKLTSQIDHPHAITVYDYGLYEGAPYLVMEFLEGNTLKDLCKQPDKFFPIERVYSFADQISGALSKAHLLQIVHRDLKPDNIMILTGDKGQDVLKVLDFGIAKLVGLEQQNISSLEIKAKPELLAGTPPYMAPEQIRGKDVDSRCDIYALGIILYQLISRKHPYPNFSNRDFIYNPLPAPVPLKNADPKRRVSEEVNRIVMKAIEKDPGKRYKSVLELMSDLKKASIGAYPPKALAGRNPGSSKAFSMEQMLDVYDKARHHFDKGNYAVAFEHLNEMIEDGGLDPQLIYLAVLSLARIGAHAYASDYFERFRGLLADTEDNLALEARLLKDRYKETGEQNLGLKARDTYREIFNKTGGYYTAINAATLSCWIEDYDTATELAEKALMLCAQENNKDYWILATLAEASLLLGRIDDTEAYLEQAVLLEPEDKASHNATYQQLKMICRKDSIDIKVLEPIAPPTVIHYTGHMINGIGSTPGIDPDDEESLIEQVKEILINNNVGIAFGSLACGADIMIAEQIHGL